MVLRGRTIEATAKGPTKKRKILVLHEISSGNTESDILDVCNSHVRVKMCTLVRWRMGEARMRSERGKVKSGMRSIGQDLTFNGDL